MSVGNNKTSKKEFQFPECWENDVRMGALFAPFRSKTVNPNDWKSKIEFWTSLIEGWCKYNACPVINLSSLKSDFSRKGMVPACLEDVLQNMYSAGVIVEKQDFFADSESWKGWAIKVLVTKPLEWTFNTFKSNIFGKDDRKQIEYIHLPVIKYLSENLIKKIPSSSQGKLINFNDLMELSNIENAENLSLILHWLQKQGSVAICKDNSLTLVKLFENGTKPPKISEVDRGICNLEKQVKVLEKNIEKLEEDKNAALCETRQYLAKKMKNLAKVSLRRKREIEKIIESRITMLENIQALLQQIDQTKQDSEVFECYQTGLVTLKKVFKETGLNEESVCNTMEQLEDILNSKKDIEEALSKPLDHNQDQILEDELTELLLMEVPEVPAESLEATELQKREKKKEQELKNKMQALSI